MASTIQLLVNGKCVSTTRVDELDPTISIKITRREEPPQDIACWTKANNISGYWISLKDIQSHFNVSMDTLKVNADKLWPNSPQRSQYQHIAEAWKEEVRNKGWKRIQLAYALSKDTYDAMEELLSISKIQDDRWKPII